LEATGGARGREGGEKKKYQETKVKTKKSQGTGKERKNRYHTRRYTGETKCVVKTDQQSGKDTNTARRGGANG